MIGTFPFPLELKRTAPRRGVLLQPFVFMSPTQGRIEVEAGFETDYASIPRIFWAFYPPDGSYTEAAVVHDYLYWFQPISREAADLVFLEGMQAQRVPYLRRHLLHKSVRVGGWKAWRDNRRQRLAGIPVSP